MAATSVTPRKKRKAFIFQIAIVLFLLGGMWFSFGQNVLTPQKQGGPPVKLSQMKLASVVEGQQALAQVNQLHGTNLGLKSAYIAEYSHTFNPYHANDEKATVWVGKSDSGGAALALLERMRGGIAKGGSPFSTPEKMTVAGQEVYKVEGMGDTHFFYQSWLKQEEVVWVTIKSVNPVVILEEALKLF